MTVTVAVLLVARHGAMRAIAHPVGVTVRDESALEDRLDHRAQRMMHHAVAERRGRYPARFGVAHFNHGIATGTPTPVSQGALQPQQFAPQIRHECCRAGLVALTFNRLHRGLMERGKGGDLLEQVVVFFRHKRLSLRTCFKSVASRPKCKARGAQKPECT